MMSQDKQKAAMTVAEAGAAAGPGSAHPLQGQKMRGAQAVVASLEAEGVDTVFGYPGSQAIRIYDALYDSDKITHVLARHEQAAVHEADGYARATGKVGVVLVTSGPGATNTVTGIAAAYMDSVPIVVITGQVPRSLIGTDSFQESDIVGISMPIVKHSYLIKNIDELSITFREAFHIAKTGRPGPVLIDIPSDILAETAVFKYPDKVNIQSYRPTYKGNARQVKAACEKIMHAQRPVLLVGGGAVISGASKEVIELAERMRIPMVHTLMGKGAVPSDHPLCLGLVGMHGSLYANLALNKSDLIIACGARFSDRVTGQLDTFAPEAQVIHIDIDPAEIGKVREVQVPIVGDVRIVLTSMNDVLEKEDAKSSVDAWLEQIEIWRERHPFYEERRGGKYGRIAPETALELLASMLDPQNSIVVTEVGQHQMWAAQAMSRSVPRSFLSSGGLGAMGFGFPAAIGARIGCPEKQVVCIAGDGSFQMNVQEMATAAECGIPVKVVIVDNRALGMVRQWQRIFYDKRYSATEMAPVPDFCKLADAYGWGSAVVDDADELESAFAKMLEYPGPYLLDMHIARDQSVFPMVAPGRGLNEVIGAIDNERDGLRIIENESDIPQSGSGE